VDQRKTAADKITHPRAKPVREKDKKKRKTVIQTGDRREEDLNRGSRGEQFWRKNTGSAVLINDLAVRYRCIV